MLEDQLLVSRIKELFAPDGGAEREHNAVSGTLGFGLVHYAIVRNLRPDHALVIGSRSGYIPVAVALALLDNGHGRLDFVDANYNDALHGFEVAFGGIGNWSEGSGEKFVALGVNAVIDIHIMRSEDFFAQCENAYGFVYIDGDHSYEGCRFDLEQSINHSTPDAMIALHDVLVNEPPYGVGKVFSELDRERFDTLIVPIWPGIGIIRRKAPP